jgi:hypothetical protein
MAISHDDCAPFVSVTLLNVGKPPVTVARLRTSILGRLQKPAATGSITRMIRQVKAPNFREGGLEVGWIHYSETRPPGWYRGSDLNETHYHSVFIVKKGELIALAFSDPALRNSITADIRRA